MVLCIVTIHGIGFERPPDDQNRVAGYADQLHTNLHGHYDQQVGAPPILGDDPNRLAAGVRGPVYVESVWKVNPAAPPSREAGLSRLGTPRADGTTDHTNPNTALVDGNAAVAHVALVYSNLEEPSAQDPGPNLGETAEIAAKTAFSLGQYASASGLVQMLFRDLAGLVQGNNTPLAAGAVLSLQPREALPRNPIQAVRNFFHRGDDNSQQTGGGGGLFDSIRALEDDVATYVCRNDLRERVRGFVREALLRLCGRDDVEGIIINAHSQGTVVAYDVVRELPHVAAGKIQGIVTAGSPLRKYVDFFSWGIEAGSVSAIGPWAGKDPRPQDQWINFYDDADPVADPLAPDWLWHRGMDVNAYTDKDGLFVRIDPETGDTSRLPITDILVNNLANSPTGGLQAHNYWDNEQQVIPQLGEFVKERA